MCISNGKPLDLLFPPTCLFCRKTLGTVFCRNCLETAPVLEQNRFFINIPGLARKLEVFSPFDYDGQVRMCIKYSKYGAKQFMALKILSLAAVEFTVQLNVDFNGFTVVPIPLNPRKFRSRGFNQAEIIGEILAQSQKIPINRSLLKRSKITTSQFENSRKARYKNLKGAFSVSKEGCRSKKILLVDDICTSGATLSEACRTLYLSGVSEVKAFTLSRRL
jgi:ComF family protein